MRERDIEKKKGRETRREGECKERERERER
jgi:hypothetical protein